jgi:arylesterase/paraoxonase
MRNFEEPEKVPQPKRRALLRFVGCLGTLWMLVGLLMAWMQARIHDLGALHVPSPEVLAAGGFGECTVVAGFPGGEDLEWSNTHRRVLISSVDFRAMTRGEPASGGLYAWDPAGLGTWVPLVVEGDFTGGLHPHGIGIWREPGRELLFVVNHPDWATSVVDIFTVGPFPTLRHLRRVEHPLFISLNDISPVGPDHFYATNDGGAPNGSVERMSEMAAGLARASVVEVHLGAVPTEGGNAERGNPADPQVRIVASDLGYANGILAMPDNGPVVVAESLGRRLRAYAPIPGGGLEPLAELDLSTGVDNLSLGPDGLLWVGAHPNMLDFLRHAADPAARSPSEVLRLRWDPAERSFEVLSRYVEDGSRLSGVSVALPLDPSGGEHHFLVGSVFESHLLDCRRHTE